MGKKVSKYKAVIGLEVHAQLLTHSKIFSTDSALYGNRPNTQVSVVTLAHPGTLPKLNKKALEFAIKMGLACHSTISRYTFFDRKNYFYPDLPKGYQITQDQTPICKGGFVKIKPKNDSERRVDLNRIHFEEDAGKSIHLEGESDTVIDFNRAGVPLIEIVTEPCMTSSEEAHAFLSEIRKLVRYLEICDGNMEEGSLRCDANVSVMLHDAKELGRKVEIKNMNSIRNVQRAIDLEVARQIELLENGNPVISETRTFNASTVTTQSMRTKEELNDYRYFPDPDISPVYVTDQWLAEIKDSMPVLPEALIEKFTSRYQLSEYDALVLTETKEIAMYFDSVCQLTTNYKAAANWIIGPIKSFLNELPSAVKEIPVTIATLAELISLVESGKVSFSVASQGLLPELVKNPGPVEELAQRLNLIQVSDEASILAIIDEVLESNADKVVEYKKGKTGILGMFMGEVKKLSKGKADPKLASELLSKRLKD
jgi:aspartyl-tRNA(Asn)/glutamyl-tRNA(Gln) amidotransferase subunit B